MPFLSGRHFYFQTSLKRLKGKMYFRNSKKNIYALSKSKASARIS